MAYLPELLTGSVQQSQRDGDWYACFAAVAKSCPRIEAMDCSFHEINIGLGLAKSKGHSEYNFDQFKVEFALMKGSRIVRAFVFVAILVVHWTGQFIAWSCAERSGSMRVLWNILATPLVHLSSSMANQYFWAVATANSILWAVIMTFVIARFALRH
jgi:hypothetical protein